MRIYKYLLICTFAGLLSHSNALADVLTVTDSISIHGTAIDTTTDSVVTTSDIVRTDESGNIDITPALYVTANQNPGGASGLVSPFQYGIRERLNFAQPERRFRSFLRFDVSTLDPAELADPNFSALFTVDYVGNLNILNSGLDVGLGQIVDGDWDSVTTLPTIDFSDNSSDLGILVEDAAINTVATSGLTVDITDLVKGWADGSIENFGLTFNVPEGSPGISNGAYFNNATVVTSTEPLSPSGTTIEVTSISRAANSDVTIEFTSPVGNVDVYRSIDLLDFGASPIASNVAPGTYLDDTAASLPKAFYILVPTGVVFPEASLE